MNRDKLYEKRARLYPVIVAMIMPFLLIIYLISKIMATSYQLEGIWNVAIPIILAILITGALTYGVKLLSRSAAKIFFQIPLFKQNETEMPTTDLLLWKNNLLSKQNISQIQSKVHTDFGLELMSEEQAQKDEKQARLLIADAVKQIREKTRENIILFKYNCNLGFIRNFIGASICAFIIVFCIGVYNLINPLIDDKLIFAVLLLILISCQIIYLVMKPIRKEYARQLFTVYLEL